MKTSKSITKAISLHSMILLCLTRAFDKYQFLLRAKSKFYFKLFFHANSERSIRRAVGQQPCLVGDDKRMGESVGWPDFLIVYTEKCKRQTVDFFGNKNGGNNGKSHIWVISYRSSYCGIPSFFLRDFGPLNKHTPNSNSNKTNKCTTREKKNQDLMCEHIGVEGQMLWISFFALELNIQIVPGPNIKRAKKKQNPQTQAIYCVPSTALGFM